MIPPAPETFDKIVMNPFYLAELSALVTQATSTLQIMTGLVLTLPPGDPANDYVIKTIDANKQRLDAFIHDLKPLTERMEYHQAEYIRQSLTDEDIPRYR